MTAGMIPPGMGHRPPAMGMGPFGGGGGVPMVPGTQQGLMGNPMNPAMMGMTPMMVSPLPSFHLRFAKTVSGRYGWTIHVTWYDAWYARYDARHDGQRSDRTSRT